MIFNDIIITDKIYISIKEQVKFLDWYDVRGFVHQGNYEIKSLEKQIEELKQQKELLRLENAILRTLIVRNYNENI